MPRPESDVREDEHVANSRETGGREADGDRDEHSTTGTTESGEYVGRVAGTDESDSRESGAEARAAAEGDPA